MTDNKIKPAAKRKAFKAAFPKTLPILAGFLFLGISYGFYMRVSGFSFFFPLLMSIVIFGGSLEFVAVSMLLSPFAPLQTFLMALVIQARHLFYGIAMLDKYKGTGKKKPYLIFGMCDESFSINCSAEIPEDVDKNYFYFFVTILNHLYWITGATLGSLIGGFIKFDTTGIDFVMTSMFIVIFLENWLKEKRHISSLIGILASIVCLFAFGKDSFLIPTMVCIIVLLALFKKPVTRGDDVQ
jgi:4-azaleucine resistance transporter AzlC